MSSNSNNIRNGGQRNPPKAPAPPRSMLANLLSSQQRAAAQSRKHMVQRAMPFANLHKDGSSGNAAIKSLSTKDGLNFGSSQAQKAARGQMNGSNKAGTKDTANDLPPPPIKDQVEDKPSPVTNAFDNSSSNVKPDGAPCIKNERVTFSAAGETTIDVRLISSDLELKTHRPIKQKSDLKNRSVGTHNKQSLTTTSNGEERIKENILHMEVDSTTNPTTLKRKRNQADIMQSIHSDSSLKVETFKTAVAAAAAKADQSKPVTDNISKKKKKEFSPFRVKVGCVVAVRFRKLAEGGNVEIKPAIKDGTTYTPVPSLSKANITKSAEEVPKSKDDALVQGDNDERKPFSSDSQTISEVGDQNEVQPGMKKKKFRKPKLFEVWTAPIPGQDADLALLGRRIRCFFPKSYLVKWKKNHSSPVEGIKRIVEGNVVSILDNDCGHGTAVGLLVDRSLLKLRPFLQVLSDDAVDRNTTPSEQKRQNLEALIRGKDKVVVKVTLSTVYESRDGSIDSGAVAQWVSAKHVLTKPSGLKPTKSERKEKGYTSHSLFVGDENDTATEQEENWRWNAGRLLQSHPDEIYSESTGIVVDSQLLGEVVNMTVDSTSQEGSTSLATVIIKRLLAPHQTKNGLMPHHRERELFDIHCNDKVAHGLYFQVPVEQLVVLGRSVTRHSSSTKNEPPNKQCYTITHSYDSNEDMYIPLSFSEGSSGQEEKLNLTVCHNCRRLGDSTKQTCDECNNIWCHDCTKLAASSQWRDEMGWAGPCCSGSTNTPSSIAKNTLDEPGESAASSSLFSSLIKSVQSTNSVAFTLPANVVPSSIKPSYVPFCDGKKRKHSKHKKQKRLGGETKEKARKKSKNRSSHRATFIVEKEDYSIFKPTCSRLISFEEVKNMKCYLSNSIPLMGEEGSSSFRNAPARKFVIRQVEKKSNTSNRAARASQRRIVKSLASLGDSIKGIDRLAGRDREAQLRFGRSLIHGWGVFATEPITAGDLIIEYRGELIGNAVADRRELEYERAKVCDYQFRIDEHIVCDATKLGNVARYINASCSPNCYTQIITANENKRIVIYAKTDIKAGEELCYDYKFPLEYDPSKRIPCHCQSSNCQGFMNWDKKYVLIEKS